jgi:serine/threonine protein kinase
VSDEGESPLRTGRVLRQIHTEFAERGSLEDVLVIIDCSGYELCPFTAIVHQDLKPSNILIKTNWRALIADFGTSRFELEDTTPEGSIVRYAALELFEGETKCTSKGDLHCILLWIDSIRNSFSSTGHPRYHVPI